MKPVLKLSKIPKYYAHDCSQISRTLIFNEMFRVYGSRYARMDQVKFFKGCLLQILVHS